SFTRTASDGNGWPARRALGLRSALGVRSPAARVRVAIRETPQTAAISAATTKLRLLNMMRSFTAKAGTSPASKLRVNDLIPNSEGNHHGTLLVTPWLFLSPASRA